MLCYFTNKNMNPVKKNNYKDLYEQHFLTAKTKSPKLIICEIQKKYGQHSLKLENLAFIMKQQSKDYR